MATKHDIRKTDDRRNPDWRRDDTPTAEYPTAPAHKTPPKKPDRPAASGQTPGRTIETPGQPGLEKEPNRDKAIGPGGQRLTSDSNPAKEADVEGVDKPDGITAIDPNGETRAEDNKLL
jgi:hypothetical protein